MGITATCQSCSRSYAVPDHLAGKTVKCRSCGQMIVLPTAAEFANDLSFADEGDSLASLGMDDTPPAMTPPEGVDQAQPAAAAPAGNRPSQARPARSTSTHGKADSTVAGTPTRSSSSAQEVEAGSPVAVVTGPSGEWANWYRHPYAIKIDYWLPRILCVLGILWLCISMVSASEGLPGWVVASRLAVLGLCYVGLVFPLALVGLKIGTGISHEGMPGGAAWRAFASYLPALTISVVLWNAGGGTTPALVMGAFLGLAISAGVVMLLFRLEPERVLGVAACGSGGFVMGGLISCLLVYGVNFLTIYGLSQSKSPSIPPVSPYWPGLAWNIQPPTATTTTAPIKRTSPGPSGTPSSVTSPATPPADPGLPGLTSSPLVARVDGSGPKLKFERLLRPSTPSQFAAVFRKGEAGTTLVERFDAIGWTKTGTTTIGEPPSADTVESTYALSPDGKRLARIAKFPKPSIQVWSYVDARVEKLIPIDPADGVPSLIGCTSANHLVELLSGSVARLRWIDLSDPTVLNTVELEGQPSGRGFVVALDPTSARVAVACQNDGANYIMIYEPKPAGFAGSKEAPRRLKVAAMSDPSIAPTGLAFSPDGAQVAAYYEQGGAGLIVTYNVSTGEQKPECIFPAAPVPSRQGNGFQGSSLAWFPGGGSWLLYGDAVIEAPGGKVVGRLAIDGVTAQRILTNELVELVMESADKPRQVVRVRLK
jgi:hypothetical protein